MNPKLIKDYGNNSLRKIQTDRADSRKIAKYGLANWSELRQYTPMDKRRRTLFPVMSSLLRTRPQDNPVYQFMNEKRAEGKPYLVCMTAGANKFLRIYYGKLNEQISPKQPNENDDKLNF